MNKSDLMNRLAEEKGFSLSTARETVDIFFEDMTQALIKGIRQFHGEGIQGLYREEPENW